MDHRMSESIFNPPNIISEQLGDAEYNRERLFPHPKDNLYVHLADIRLFLDHYKGDSFDRLLDYGCGGSPYRELFNAKNYIRADYVDSDNLDYAITSEGKIDMPDNSCDAVLSTQVLEHVFSPRQYLSEAFRVLRPGGKLILTTPGIWEDHGCPYDFRRWTYDGLRRELEDVGFTVSRTARLTTGPRAIIFLFSRIIYLLKDTPLSLSGWAFRLLRHSRFAVPESRHKWMDRHFAENRIVYGSESGHEIYLGLGIEGLKP
jgi:SAM-dependent methyltransferase